jgi:zinc/manganese transport system ATP-binding protein/zinc transport system ATP-binding protein
MHPLVELKHVAFGYGSQPTLESVDIHLHEGQFMALVGPSGAGKTTLLRLVLGLLAAQHGEITRRDNMRIAYVPQLETVDWNFPVTAIEVVLMGLTMQSGWWPWPKSAERNQALAIMRQLEIDHLANNHIRDLSGGQQQRVFLARALVAQPDLLILDEPTTGVDLRSAENIFHQLAQLNHDGMTILLTTHDLNMAAAHVPWVVCLNKTVVAQGSPHETFTEAILSETYEGEMMVIVQNGIMWIQQKPHGHALDAVQPDPVAGGMPGHSAELEAIND